MTNSIKEMKIYLYVLFPALAFSLGLILQTLYPFDIFNHWNVRIIINVTYLLILLCLVGIGIQKKNENLLQIESLIQIIQMTAIFAAVTLCLQLMGTILPIFHIGILDAWDKINLMSRIFRKETIAVIPNLGLIAVLALSRLYYKKQQFKTNQPVEKTTGNFGTAAWMSEKELYEKGCYDPNSGPMVGMDAKEKLLHLPLLNTLILAPPGLGKSLRNILALLTEDRPIFTLDIKGELWATTARFRAEKMNRQVIAIDPYGITKKYDFLNKKPASLKFEYHFNPFDYLPEEESERDRMLTAFATSFIVSDRDHSGTAKHFDENAKILIRGYMDFMMKKFGREERTLAKLFSLISESKDAASDTFNEMVNAGGKAAAAANQILRVGGQERGSILSTTYRQIDWLNDLNMQHTLSESNFSLGGFLKGNMDIYVILPNEQVHEQSRLVRMLLALLKAIITQVNPSDLPAKKMLFLLDELAQFGYCPDVEQFIEVMRSYKVVIWSVFQALSQIKQYKKPDLFLSMPIKQFFTLDDVDTMKWIQYLGGKTTINTKGLSTTSGNTHQKMQVYGGSISTSETENVHEAGIDLIKLNEIRELPLNEQFVFWSGQKPIRCKKVFYYKHPQFVGRFDENPLEKYMKPQEEVEN
jgi:type IV secretion system protein VirD4